MLKKLEGYQIKTIFKYMAKKDGFGLAECSTIEKEKQQEEILSVLKKKGKAFGIYRKKELAACYLFEKVKVLESEIPYPKYDINKENVWNFITGHEVEETKEDVADESENLNDTTEDAADANDSLNDSKADEKKATADKEVYVYRLAKIYNQSVPAEVAEEFEKAILAEFKELIAMDEVKAVLWNEKILAAKRVNAGTFGYVSAIPLGISIGLMFGVVFDNIALGLLLGMSWGLLFGTIFTSAGSRKQEGK